MQSDCIRNGGRAVKRGWPVSQVMSYSPVHPALTERKEAAVDASSTPFNSGREALCESLQVDPQ